MQTQYIQDVSKIKAREREETSRVSTADRPFSGNGDICLLYVSPELTTQIINKILV